MGVRKYNYDLATDLLRQGMPLPKVAMSIGADRSELRRALKRRGLVIPKMKPGRQFRLAAWDAIADQYAAGKPISAISRSVKMSPKSVYYAVRQMAERRGLSLRPRTVQGRGDAALIAEVRRRAVERSERNVKIAEMYQRGMSNRDIGRALNVDPSTATRVLTAMGIPRRDRYQAAATAKQKTRPRAATGEFVDYSEYRRIWRETHGKPSPRIERMLELAAPRKSRFAA